MPSPAKLEVIAFVGDIPTAMSSFTAAFKDAPMMIYLRDHEVCILITSPVRSLTVAIAYPEIMDANYSFHLSVSCVVCHVGSDCTPRECLHSGRRESLRDIVSFSSYRDQIWFLIDFPDSISVWTLDKAPIP